MTHEKKQWYQQYPEIIHIDGTYRTNARKYALFSFVVQSSTLSALPCCFAYMRDEKD